MRSSCWLVHMICWGKIMSVFCCASRNSFSRCVSIIVYVHTFLRVCFASFERTFFVRILRFYEHLGFLYTSKFSWKICEWKRDHFLLKTWWIYLRPTVFKCHMSRNENGKKSNHYLRWIETETEQGLMCFSKKIFHIPHTDGIVYLRENIFASICTISICLVTCGP